MPHAATAEINASTPLDDSIARMESEDRATHTLIRLVICAGLTVAILGLATQLLA